MEQLAAALGRRGIALGCSMTNNARRTARPTPNVASFRTPCRNGCAALSQSIAGRAAIRASAEFFGPQYRRGQWCVCVVSAWAAPSADRPWGEAMTGLWGRRSENAARTQSRARDLALRGP